MGCGTRTPMSRVENVKRRAKQQQHESGDDQPMLCRVQTAWGREYSWPGRSCSARRRNMCGGDLNRCDEPVASARNGFDESRITRLIPESFSDLEYRHSQAFVEFDKGILRPESISNFFPRNNLPGAFHK